MLFRQLFDTTSRTYTYLIASGTGREALLIDPVLEQVPLYIRLFEELKLKLVLTLETHTHTDHITAAGSLQDKFHSQIAMGETTQAEKEGEKIAISEIKLEALLTLPDIQMICIVIIINDGVFMMKYLPVIPYSFVG